MVTSICISDSGYSCCVFKKKNEKRKVMKHELDLCIFDCIIKQKDCVFMYVVAIKDRHCLELLSFYTPLLQRWSVQDSFFLYISKHFKYINFIFHSSCAICCVDFFHLLSNHAIHKGTILRWGSKKGRGDSCQLNCVHSLPVRLLITCVQNFFQRRK